MNRTLLHFLLGLFGRPEKETYFANIERHIDTSGLLILEYPTFKALALAAKDSKGDCGSILQGTKGVIRTSHPANIIGIVTLELNDGTVEVFEGSTAADRLIPEFKAFIQAINSDDKTFCEDHLERSLMVSTVQSKARREAGIHFPADER